MMVANWDSGSVWKLVTSTMSSKPSRRAEGGLEGGEGTADLALEVGFGAAVLAAADLTGDEQQLPGSDRGRIARASRTGRGGWAEECFALAMARSLTTEGWMSLLGELAAEEIPNVRGDLAMVCLEREVARVQQVDLCVGIPGGRRRAGREEEGVVLAPDREHRRAVLAELGLKLRVERHVGPIARIRSSWISSAPGRCM